MPPARPFANILAMFVDCHPRIHCAAALLVLGGCVSTPAPHAAPSPMAAPAARPSPIAAPATVGYLVMDLESGQVLAARNADRPFVPASTVKLLTAVAALEVLGADHRFQTRLMTTGEGTGGRLAGDLLLVGGGDPLLGLGDLMGLATRLADKGIREIGGRFLYDQSWAPPVAAIDPGQPADAPYNAGVGALALDFNRQRLTWDAAGATYMTPPAPEAARPGRLDEASAPGVRAHWRDGRWMLAATEAAGSIELPVKQPGLATARIFRALAGRLGIRVPVPEPGTAPAGATTLARLTSAPLADVVRQGLEYSNNVVAEMIGLATARALGLTAPTPASAAARLQRLFETRLAGSDWSGLRLRNLSGLSWKSHITPRQMVALLRHADGRRFGGWPLRALLPTAGQRGSFRGRFRDPGTALRMWAKTGTMHYAKGLAGYLLTANGRRLAFAVYGMDETRRQAYDADPAREGPAGQARARDWIVDAEAHEEALVRSWLSTY